MSAGFGGVDHCACESRSLAVCGQELGARHRAGARRGQPSQGLEDGDRHQGRRDSQDVAQQDVSERLVTRCRPIPLLPLPPLGMAEGGVCRSNMSHCWRREEHSTGISGELRSSIFSSPFHSLFPLQSHFRQLCSLRALGGDVWVFWVSLTQAGGSVSACTSGISCSLPS